MLALAGVNLLAAAMFAALYAAGGTRWISQPTFLAGLALLFAGLTVLWVHVEGSRPGRADVLSRLGRIAVGFALAAAAFPALALMPLFALRRELPAEAGMDHLLPGAMVATLAALTLTAGVNCAGIVYGLVGAAVRRARSRP